MKKFYRQSLFTFAVALVALGLHVHVISAHTQFDLYKHDKNIKQVDLKAIEGASNALLELMENNEQVLSKTVQLQSYEIQIPQNEKIKISINKEAAEETVVTEKVVKEEIHVVEMKKPALPKVSLEIKSEPLEVTVDSRPTLNTRDVGNHNGFSVDTVKLAATIQDTRAEIAYQRQNISGVLAQLRQEEELRIIAMRNEEALKIDKNKKQDNKILEDSVEVIAAKSFEKKEVDEFEDDDFVVFDYSSQASHASQEKTLIEETKVKEKIEAKMDIRVAQHMGDLPNVQISSNVQNTIGRALEREVKETSDKIDTSSIPDEIIAAMKNTQQQRNRSDVDDYASVISSAINNADNVEGMNSQLTVRPFEVKIGLDMDSQGGSISNFEFISGHDRNDYSHSVDGEIVLNKNLRANSGVVRATIIRSGYLRMNTELYIERGSFVQPVPMFEQFRFNELLEERGLRGLGANLLVEIDETIAHTEIDAHYEEIIYLDRYFQIIENEEEDYRYVLYIGVESGNTLISYYTDIGMIADHIVHLVEDELTYAVGMMNSHGREEIELFERNIMSRQAQNLTIPHQNVNYFNQKSNTQRIALNRYGINRPMRPVTMRRYYEINSFGPILMTGVSEGLERIELPSQNFVNHVFDAFRTSELAGRCLVQLNFSEEIERISYEGETFSGPMYVEEVYLDKDGVFSEYESDFTSNAFFMGDLQGVINIRVEYSNGSSDYIQTFCSPDTYLVEQL